MDKTIQIMINFWKSLPKEGKGGLIILSVGIFGSFYKLGSENRSLQNKLEEKDKLIDELISTGYSIAFIVVLFLIILMRNLLKPIATEEYLERFKQEGPSLVNKVKENTVKESDSLKSILLKNKGNQSEEDDAAIVNEIENVIKRGIKFNFNQIIDDDHDSPLHISVSRNYVKVAEFLTKQLNINVNIKNKKRLTPLLLAVQRKCKTEIINLLLKNGANPNEKDPNNQRTPLHYAVEQRNIEVVRALFDSASIKPDPDLQDKKGQTPLHLSIQQLNSDTTIYLIEKSATINIRDNNRKTPLDILKQKEPKGFELFLSCTALQALRARRKTLRAEDRKKLEQLEKGKEINQLSPEFLLQENEEWYDYVKLYQALEEKGREEINFSPKPRRIDCPPPPIDLELWLTEFKRSEAPKFSVSPYRYFNGKEEQVASSVQNVDQMEKEEKEERPAYKRRGHRF